MRGKHNVIYALAITTITLSLLLTSLVILAVSIEPQVIHSYKRARIRTSESVGYYEEYTSADSVYVQMVDSTPYIVWWDWGYTPRQKYWIAIFNEDIYR